MGGRFEADEIWGEWTWGSGPDWPMNPWNGRRRAAELRLGLGSSESWLVYVVLRHARMADRQVQNSHTCWSNNVKFVDESRTVFFLLKICMMQCFYFIFPKYIYHAIFFFSKLSSNIVV